MSIELKPSTTDMKFSAQVGSESFAPEVKFKSGLSPLPECGSEGHPDTGELVIVLCSEANEKSPDE
jgi:hypothetical protein